MASGNEAVAAVVAGATGDEDSFPLVERLELEDWAGLSMDMIAATWNVGCEKGT